MAASKAMRRPVNQYMAVVAVTNSIAMPMPTGTPRALVAMIGVTA